MSSRLIISVIADYGDLHDLAFAEVTQSLEHELAGLSPTIYTYAVPAFDTIATGFALAQTALNSKLGTHHKFFVNTAPRKDDLQPRTKNAGEGFVYAKLKNGCEICVVNSGYSLSFVREAAVEVRVIDCSAEGSQFRSRDVFPRAFARVLRGDRDILGADMMDAIPAPPEGVVCYTDGYGNLKCAVDPAELQSIIGKYVVLEINGRQQVARVSQGIFGVADGEFSLSAGSSGWTLPSGKRVQFAEVIKRGGNAARQFGRPPGGVPVMWRVVH